MIGKIIREGRGGTRNDIKNTFSLRKLSVGLASVAIGTCIFSTNAKIVKADVISDQAIKTGDAQTATAQTQSNDVQNEQKLGIQEKILSVFLFYPIIPFCAINSLYYFKKIA